MPETADERILLFVKYPLPGSVKSRLARGIGDEAACRLYRSFVADLLTMLDGVSQKCTVCHYPAASGVLMNEWLGERRYFPQQGNNLGERMERATSAAFADGAATVVLIGSDLPALAACHISDAFNALAAHDVVLGPAADGGYYLLGMTRIGFMPELFRDIPWSTPAVLAMTQERLAEAGRSVALLEELRDVDTIEDLAVLADDIRCGRVTAPLTAVTLAESAPALCLPSPS